MFHHVVNRVVHPQGVVGVIERERESPVATEKSAGSRKATRESPADRLVLDAGAAAVTRCPERIVRGIVCDADLTPRSEAENDGISIRSAVVGEAKVFPICRPGRHPVERVFLPVRRIEVGVSQRPDRRIHGDGQFAAQAGGKRVDNAVNCPTECPSEGVMVRVSRAADGMWPQ